MILKLFHLQTCTCPYPAHPVNKFQLQHRATGCQLIAAGTLTASGLRHEIGLISRTARIKKVLSAGQRCNVLRVHVQRAEQRKHTRPLSVCQPAGEKDASSRRNYRTALGINCRLDWLLVVANAILCAGGWAALSCAAGGRTDMHQEE